MLSELWKEDASGEIENGSIFLVYRFWLSRELQKKKQLGGVAFQIVASFLEHLGYAMEGFLSRMLSELWKEDASSEIENGNAFLVYQYWLSIELQKKKQLGWVAFQIVASFLEHFWLCHGRFPVQNVYGNEMWLSVLNQSKVTIPHLLCHRLPLRSFTFYCERLVTLLLLWWSYMQSSRRAQRQELGIRHELTATR
jgi:hypothetical protein